MNVVLMVAVFAAVVRYFPTATDMQQKVTRQYPVRAVEYLRQHPVPGPMYNTYGYGGYLIFRCPDTGSLLTAGLTSTSAAAHLLNTCKRPI